MGRAYLSVRATGGAVKPPHIGGGLEEVDVSFVSFLCAKEKSEDEVFLCAKEKSDERVFFVLKKKRGEVLLFIVHDS
jgi:hypothetical protein